MERLKRLLSKSQLVRYVLAGGMTTAVNYVIYFSLTMVGVNYIVANSISWLGAVIFSFAVNRSLVFKVSESIVRQFCEFAALRLATLAIENVLLYVMVEFISAGEGVSKLAVSVLTVALNYFACKYKIFAKRSTADE